MRTYPFCTAPVQYITGDPDPFPVDGDFGRRVHKGRMVRSNMWGAPGVTGYGFPNGVAA